MHWLTDMADVLRSARVNVHEVAGWQALSFPGWPGFNPGTPTHIMVHHTASNPGSDGAADVNFILRGASWGGPICNLYLDRSGTWWVIAAGRSATSGGGADTWGGGVPADMMNHYSIGIEAANNGVGEPWPAVQTTAYVRGVAALCRAYGVPVGHVRAHFEWSPGRKIDPAGVSPWAAGRASWNMDAFRASVLRELNPPKPPTIPPPAVIVPPATIPPTPPTTQRNDMSPTVKIASNNAVFLVNGPAASWVQSGTILSELVHAGVASTPVATISPATLATFTLYGDMPPGFTATQFAAHITTP